MNKVKFLTITSIALLLTNLALIAFIVLKKPPHPGENGPRNLIIEKLKFDEKQVLEYDKLIQFHRAEINKSEQQIFLLKNQLYGNLNNESGNVIKDSIIHELSLLQTNIETIHYKHFEDIKNLCHENQKSAFETLTHEIATLFNRPLKKEERK